MPLLGAGASRPLALTIAEAKIRDYLLNVDHPEGGPKARFFLSCGFSADVPQTFLDAVFAHASELHFVREQAGRWGTKSIFEGPLVTPDGRNPFVRSVWHRLTPGSLAELVTAYPIRLHHP